VDEVKTLLVTLAAGLALAVEFQGMRAGSREFGK